MTVGGPGGGGREAKLGTCVIQAQTPGRTRNDDRSSYRTLQNSSRSVHGDMEPDQDAPVVGLGNLSGRLKISFHAA